MASMPKLGRTDLLYFDVASAGTARSFALERLTSGYESKRSGGARGAMDMRR
jgi:hypothetical protein